MPGPGEWARYRRTPGLGVEALHAHFSEHVYRRHSHATYSFGVTDDGAQSFFCRGAAHVSAAGMVMIFNPEDVHDGQTAVPGGFTYRMIHVDPALVCDALEGAPAPLFARPVTRDPALASLLRALHDALTFGGPLEQEERLRDAVAGIAARASTRPRVAPPPRASGEIARRVRRLLDERALAAVSGQEVAEAAGCSRFAAYRAFRSVVGLAPSEYQRQLRLRRACALLTRGIRPADVAAASGFTDQAHLTRWFVRTLGVTPAAYQRALSS